MRYVRSLTIRIVLLHHCRRRLHNLFISGFSSQCFVVYFRRCRDCTLKMCKAVVDGWSEHVAAMATDCPTFSQGVQHIYNTLRDDCDNYEERLRELEEVRFCVWHRH